VSNGRGLSANDFRVAFRSIRENYRTHFEPRIADLRVAYATPTRRNPRLEQALEAHVRMYVIDGMLSALRWVIVPSTPDDIANMIPEGQIDPATGERRFMDYLGFEREVDQPLLVVEAKRPSKFPVPANGSVEAAPALISQWLVEPASAETPWDEWLPSLADYVRAVALRTGRFPVRTAITDGNWLVIFESPQDSFAQGANPNPDLIHVFMCESEIIERYDKVFALLDQYQVSRRAEDLPPGAIRGAVDPQHVASLMHGLRLHYASDETFGHLVPTISVLPVIFLRSNSGSWLKVAHKVVDTEAIRSFPIRYDELATHLANVREDAERLLDRVQHQLGNHLEPTDLVDHYRDDAFESLHGVEELPGRSDDFWIVTGQATHFLLSAPEEIACRYHDFGRAREDQCQALENPLINPSINRPRAFFTNGRAHHCCNEDVFEAKRVLIQIENLDRCGTRSGRIKDKFCEIARVEELLCCRLCAFHDVCSGSEILVLPCTTP